jgi:phosphohistidine swiveling domain-containing protein
MPLTTTYKCPDGTDFPVLWDNPEDESLTWVWEQEHAPLPATPLDSALNDLSKPGMDRAQAEAGLPVYDIFPRSIQPNGFFYFLAAPPPPLPRDEAARRQRASEEFLAKHGEGRGVWERYCLPRIKDACLQLQQAEEDVPLRDLAELHGYANGLTFVPFGQGLRQLIDFLAAEFGPEAPAFAELTSGFANATMQADQALWELADMARRSPSLRERLVNRPEESRLEALADVEGGADFLATFHRYLDSYGWRTEGWDTSSRTWHEHPSIPLALISQILRDDSPSPREIMRRSARRRRVVARAVARRLEGEKRIQFEELLARVSGWVSVKEGRAYWQLRSSGALRSALLRKGDAFTRAGRVSAPDDIFYLLPEEIEELENGDLSQNEDAHSLVETRRHERQKWLHVIPPRIIGRTQVSSTGQQATEERVIKGTPASAGIARGRARVLRDLSEADRLQRGDILVAPMTSPPWTILFGRAAAIVTDSGGITSHPSVAAREYGIPSVVGAQVATQRIRDGMLLTVDGTRGLIHIEDE